MIVGRDHPLRRSLQHIIRTGIEHHPRSQQVQIGPSEVGCPCPRRIAYRLAGVPQRPADRVPWRATVGTAVHAWLAELFVQASTEWCRRCWQPGDHDHDTGEVPTPYAVEQRVHVAPGLSGGADLYSHHHDTVVDWKIPGKTTVDKVRRSGEPDQQYQVQAHLYGLGFKNAGENVKQVAICYIPAAGELSDMVLWVVPYDEKKARDALTRLDAIQSLVSNAGTAAISVLPTADAYCDYCPWYRPGAKDITKACPGHEEGGTNGCF